MSRDELELNLLVEFSHRVWHDFTEEARHLDPDAVETYCTGRNVEGRECLVFLSRYDEGDKYALVSYRGEKHGAITKDQVHIEWLWEHVEAAVEAADQAVVSPDGP